MLRQTSLPLSIRERRTRSDSEGAVKIFAGIGDPASAAKTASPHSSHLAANRRGTRRGSRNICPKKFFRRRCETEPSESLFHLCRSMATARRWTETIYALYG